jgi:choline dehydrogenase
MEFLIGRTLSNALLSLGIYDDVKNALAEMGFELEFVRNHAETAFHPCGTCKMGFDEMAVVDGEGRVHGLEGLRVVDASIMPQIITGNLNATTIMIGEKIADAIRGREPLAKSTAAYYVANGAPVRR